MTKSVTIDQNGQSRSSRITGHDRQNTHHGFSDSDVAKTPLGWMVRTEPRLWRRLSGQIWAMRQQPTQYIEFGCAPFLPNWQITYSTGKFQGNDTGHRLASSHYFYDYAIQLYVRKTGPSNLLPNNNAFMGFAITFPLGPNKAAELGPVTVRARDRWELGLETKI